MKRRRLTRAEQQAQTRQALIDAAGRVFVERGFLGASVEAIAEEAGYSRGAFYANFESKEQLFAELLQQRVYVRYRALVQDAKASRDKRPSLRELSQRLADIQKEAESEWEFRLWLELLAHAGRDERFREIASTFWRDNRAASADAITAAYADRQSSPPVAADHLASAMIALDIGLAIQHFVDPEVVPVALYPELYELLFAKLSS